MWEFAKDSKPVARKTYKCQAWPWINNSDLTEHDFCHEDWSIIELAIAEGCMIRPGDMYVKRAGRWDGEFATFRARLDLHGICLKYNLYVD